MSLVPWSKSKLENNQLLKQMPDFLNPAICETHEIVREEEFLNVFSNDLFYFVALVLPHLNRYLASRPGN